MFSDDNALARILGQLSPEDIQAMGGPNALAQALQAMPAPRYDIAPMQQNSMRVESGPDAGKVTSLDFANQPQGNPAYGGAVAAGPARPAPMRTVGYGDGTVTDLGADNAPAAPIDFSRGMADIPGVGKGYYTKDGRTAIVSNPDGTKTKVILGYDMAGSMALNKANLERDQGQAQIAHLNEQIAASQQARNTKEGIPGMGIPQSVLEKQFGKAPEGKRWTEQGSLEDVPGGGGGKLTESQGKAAGLASRADAAHKILTDLEAQGVMTPSLTKQAAESVPMVGGGLAIAINKMGIPTEPQNKVEQAQRDFVNAALRVESGASISQSEFDNARKQYFPQPGDTTDVVRQKQQAREREIRSLAIQAGPGASTAGVSTQPIQTSGADRGRAIFDAKKAIRDGRNKAVIAQRLQGMGIDPREAGI